MKINYCAKALLAIMAIPVFALAQLQPFTRFTSDDLKEDFQYAFALLKKQHPNPYKFEDSVSVQRKFDSLVGRMDEAHNIVSVMRYSPIQLFHDVHLKIDFDEDIVAEVLYSIRHFPLALASIQNRIIVNTAGGPIKFGSEILSINKMPAAQIWNELNYATYSDGFIKSGPDRIGANLSLLVSLIFPNTANYEIVYKTSESAKPKTITLASIDAKSAYHIRTHGQLPFNTFLTRNQFTKEYLDSQSTAILTVMTFMTDEVSFYKELKIFFQEVKKRKINNVILDIRTNGGGDPKMAALMYSFISLTPFDNVFQYRTRNIELYGTENLLNAQGVKIREEDIAVTRNFLEQRYDYDSTTGFYYGNNRLAEGSIRNYPPDKNNFKGNIYLLTSGATVSAATYFAALVKKNHRGLIIGTETGSGETSTTAAWFNTYILPKTKAKLLVPMSEIYFMDSKEDKGRGCVPDRKLTFEQFQQDIQLSKDPEIAYALDIIRRENFAQR